MQVAEMVAGHLQPLWQLLQEQKKPNSLCRNYARGARVTLTAAGASPHTETGLSSGGHKVSAGLGEGAFFLDKLLGKPVVANTGGED